jgi:hypothetical protein
MFRGVGPRALTSHGPDPAMASRGIVKQRYHSAPNYEANDLVSSDISAPVRRRGWCSFPAVTSKGPVNGAYFS